jgi:hypothetical protein
MFIDVLMVVVVPAPLALTSAKGLPSGTEGDSPGTASKRANFFPKPV